MQTTRSCDVNMVWRELKQTSSRLSSASKTRPSPALADWEAGNSDWWLPTTHEDLRDPFGPYGRIQNSKAAPAARAAWPEITTTPPTAPTFPSRSTKWGRRASTSRLLTRPLIPSTARGTARRRGTSPKLPMSPMTLENQLIANLGGREGEKMAKSEMLKRGAAEAETTEAAAGFQAEVRARPSTKQFLAERSEAERSEGPSPRTAGDGRGSRATGRAASTRPA